MASFLDVCRFTATSSGSGDFVVSAAVTGYQTPASAGAVSGAIYRYRAESSDLSQWEVGYGAYTVAGTSLARTIVLFNSAGTTAKVTFSTVPQVAIVALAEDLNISNPYENKFRNPAFQIWQRGTSLTVVSGSYTADGWIEVFSGGTPAISQVSNTRSGALTTYGLQITGNVSNTDVIVKQRIESFIAAPLAGQPVTVQAQVFNNTGASITPTITVKHANAADNWGASTTDVSAVSLQACANAAWTQISYTFTAHASSGNGLEVTFDFGNNFSTNVKTLIFSEADIRLSTTVGAPSFREYTAELLFCQRYYWRLNSSGTANYIFMAQCYNTSAAWGSLGLLPTPMRATPTVNISNQGHLSGTNSGGTLVAFTAVAFGANSVSPQVIGPSNLTGASGLAAGNATIVAFNSASAWIDATAEL